MSHSFSAATVTQPLFCLQVAKSVSLRLYNELEVVQKKNSQLEWENEALREKTQELEVAKQVLQTEAEKAREVRCESPTLVLVCVSEYSAVVEVPLSAPNPLGHLLRSLKSVVLKVGSKGSPTFS